MGRYYNELQYSSQLDYCRRHYSRSHKTAWK